jgi:hypothetical protein
MTDPIAARPAVEHDATEGQLVRLISELGGGVVVERMVRNLLGDVRQFYTGARVRRYLAILIERDMRARLEQADARGAGMVDFPVSGDVVATPGG